MASRTINTITEAVDLAAKQGWQFINPNATNPAWSYQPPTIDDSEIHFVMRSPIASELDERFKPKPSGWPRYVTAKASLRKAHISGEFGCDRPTFTGCSICRRLLANLGEFKIALSDGKLDGPILEGANKKVRLSELVGRVKDLKYASSIEAVPAAIEHRKLQAEATEALRRHEAAKLRLAEAEREHARVAALLEAAQEENDAALMDYFEKQEGLD